MFFYIILYIFIRVKAVSCIALYDSGFNQVQISKQLNISHCCVENVINKYKQLDIYEDSKLSGRPKTVDGQGFGHLNRLVRGDARLSVTKVTSDLNGSLPKPETTRTVHTYLKELDFEYLVTVKKQRLSIQHLQQRVAWCTMCMKGTFDDWKHVIFFG